MGLGSQLPSNGFDDEYAERNEEEKQMPNGEGHNPADDVFMVIRLQHGDEVSVIERRHLSSSLKSWGIESEEQIITNHFTPKLNEVPYGKPYVLILSGGSICSPKARQVVTEWDV